MPRLEIHLFSPFRVIVDGSEVPSSAWHGRIPRLLLKMLALARRGRSTDELMDMLWPDTPPKQARQKLYEAVSRLRRTLTDFAKPTAKSGERAPFSPWPIETYQSGYRLSPSAWVDVSKFHHDVSLLRQLVVTDRAKAIEAALQLPELGPDDLLVEEPYVDWVLTARERVYEDVLAVQRLKVELLLEQSRERDALDALQHVLTLDPTCEATAGQAMGMAFQLGERSHRQLGRQPGARGAIRDRGQPSEVDRARNTGNVHYHGDGHYRWQGYGTPRSNPGRHFRRRGPVPRCLSVLRNQFEMGISGYDL